ncbi:ABC-three component system protein [Tuberibacillus sp. Marseille-P3662]|uniref:ABC-three component system protein n=1 Tax=Tuberibacillus sp. Marseille-P3662 TaxID=1965358 RepID=UPI000A1CBF02|nr:ABC-three component system protein [Tuberibacillus sp. Marseille-P3662]
MSPKRRKLTPNENAILLSEVENMCPLCTKSLMYEKNGKTNKIFEAAHIFPLNPTSHEAQLLSDEEKLNEDVNHVDNFIALCRDCHKKFDNPRTEEEYRKLVKIKKSLIKRTQTRENYFNYGIETEIKEILMTLVEDEVESKSIPLSMNALRLEDKANKTLTVLTKRRIRGEITDYYLYIQKQFRLLNKQYPNSFDMILSQVKTFYLKLRKTESSQEEIFNRMTEWLSKKTENSNINACSIIISFFIQNCEVF